MNRIGKTIITLFISGFFSFNLYGQQQAPEHAWIPEPEAVLHETPGKHTFRHHRLSLLLYHNYINIKTADGLHLLIIPALGLDYECWFNEH